jgi:HIV Tat-specific factor 1
MYQFACVFVSFRCLGSHKVSFKSQYNPEGVVAVKFKDPIAANRCIQVMNGRWFGGRSITAEYYDGVTNYKVEESEEQKKRRLASWAKYLGTEEE